MNKTILIIGGAGYIGSHTAFLLHEKGYNVLVLDDLSTGHKEFLRFGEHILGDVNNTQLLASLFEKHRIDGIMHFAAFTLVGESVSNPQKYYENNLIKTFNLLKTAHAYNVGNIIFSSSCAVYGEPKTPRLNEEHSFDPINAYGRSKLAVEWMLKDFSQAYGMPYTSLRYFNAAGALPASYNVPIGEWHEPESHIIPLALSAAEDESKYISIFGTDYPTPDGTCIRDYIHVCDLAQAHHLALERLWAGEKSDAFNLGNGQGYSVRQIIATAERITEKSIHIQEAPRRPGDPPALICDAQKAHQELGWKPQFTDLDDIIRTAWQWKQQKNTLSW